MMRNFLLYIFLFSFLFVSGQTRHVQLNWGTTSQKSTSITSSQKPNTLESNLFFNVEENKYVEQWVDNSFANPSSITLSNIVFETISANDIQGIDISLIPNEVKYTISSNLGRDIIYTSFSFTPVILQNGIYKKVLSLDIAYTKAPQNNYNSIGLTNSVLASGNWYRFKVEKTGIHRIDKNFLNSLGMNTNNLEPRKIKIYGNGGNMLPLRNSENSEFDPTENAIQVIGEQDGSFDSGDFILFYGETQQFNEDSNTHINLYDDNAYYYITADGQNGLRINLYNEPSGVATTTITQFNDYQFHEIDDANPALVGRRWFGNRFDINNQQTFEFSFPNIISGQPMQFKIFAIAAS
ncbi:MAG: peptidase C25, partial [Flavobacteriaceae bacterium CG_4_9_14_0_8_um_filter_34_30]